MKVELNEFDIELDGQVEIYYLNSEKYSGIVYELFKNKLASEFELVNGIKNGYEKEFFASGTIESCSMYKNGLLSGLTKNYYETRELQEEAFFEYGICLWHKLYDENGEIEEHFNIDENSADYKLLEAFRRA